MSVQELLAARLAAMEHRIAKLERAIKAAPAGPVPVVVKAAPKPPPPKPKTEAFRDLVVRVVAENFGIDSRLLAGKLRKSELIIPRHVAWWIIREYGQFSYPQIAELFGGRNHATILYGVREIETVRQHNSNFAQDTDKMLAHVQRVAVEQKLTMFC